MIAERLASLEAAIKTVQREDYLGPDSTTLINGLQSDVTGLEALATKIAGDTSASTAQSDSDLIFSDFRVYDLVLPVVRDVSYVDWADNVKLGAIGKQVTYLQGRENSNTQSFLVPLVTDMQLQVQTATTSTNGLSSQLLGYTAADWGANHNLLDAADANIYVTQKAITTAEKDYNRALQLLRSERKHHGRR
jgi:hypothetical protein